jgi:hypothetical protein
MNKPLTWWKKMLPRTIWPFLSKLWFVTLILSSIAILFGLEIAIFGLVPGVANPATIQNTALILVLSSALLNIVTFIAGFGHDLRRMYFVEMIPGTNGPTDEGDIVMRRHLTEK